MLLVRAPVVKARQEHGRLVVQTPVVLRREPILGRHVPRYGIAVIINGQMGPVFGPSLHPARVGQVRYVRVIDRHRHHLGGQGEVEVTDFRFRDRLDASRERFEGRRHGVRLGGSAASPVLMGECLLHL